MTLESSCSRQPSPWTALSGGAAPFHDQTTTTGAGRSVRRRTHVHVDGRVWRQGPRAHESRPACESRQPCQRSQSDFCHVERGGREAAGYHDGDVERRVGLAHTHDRRRNHCASWRRGHGLGAGGGHAPSVRACAHTWIASHSRANDLCPLSDATGRPRSQLEADRTVTSADAELALATQRLQRLERLLVDGAASRRSVEEARAAQKIAEANATAASARSKDLGRSPTGTGGGMMVRTPIAGVLQSITAAPGQTVAASTPLFQVTQVEALWVRVQVFVGERAAVDRSKPAEVLTLNERATSIGLAKPATGPPSADPATATSDLFYALESPGILRPGERVSVRLPLSGVEQALVVPSASVVYDMNGGAWVYEVTGATTFVRRRIEIRLQIGGKTLSRAVIDAGKKVVIERRRRAVRHRIRSGQVTCAGSCRSPFRHAVVILALAVIGDARRGMRRGSRHSSRRLSRIRPAAGRNPDRGTGALDAGSRGARQRSD